MAGESNNKPNGRARDFLRMVTQIKRSADDINDGVLATGYFLGRLEEERGKWSGQPGEVLALWIRLLRVTVGLRNRRRSAAA